MAEQTADAALEVRGLRRTFGARVAVDDLNLNVTRGSVYGFLGPNGAGKTTAMRCILGLIRSDAGQIAIFGETDPVKRRQNVGALVETPTFYEWMSGRANLEIACAYSGVPNERVAEALERVGLAARGDNAVSGYSLGMKQRLGIARCLLTRPQLLMLDEPTNGLDPAGMKDVRDLIISLAAQDQITVFISSHILKEIEAVASRVGIIQDGRMIAEGEVSELLLDGGKVEVEVESPEPEKLREVLGGLPQAVITGVGERGLRVTLTELQPHELNAQLVQAGVPVSFLGGGRDLEELFLDLTRSGGIQ